jgi:hypothetical protein
MPKIRGESSDRAMKRFSPAEERRLLMVVVFICLSLLSSTGLVAQSASHCTTAGATKTATLNRSSCRILTGPEIRVSGENVGVYDEMMIAAHLTDKTSLVAASSYTSGGGTTARVASSHDGGHTWSWFDPPNSGTDEVITFLPSGSAVFLTFTKPLSYAPLPAPWSPMPYDRCGNAPCGVVMYRSDDGGSNWSLVQSGIRIGDHPVIAVDRTNGARRGTIYVIDPDKITRLSEYGKVVADSSPIHGSFNQNGSLAVLSDGSLLAAKKGGLGRESDTVVTVTSSDGGRTWSEPRRVGLVLSLQRSPKPNPLPFLYTAGYPTLSLGSPVFVADVSEESRFKDRVYCAWVEILATGSHIWITASGDRGQTWSKPIRITAIDSGFQFQPTLATNRAGVLGIMFYDTRGFAAEQKRFNAYFAASIDGGMTFLPSQRITSAPSTMVTAAHQRPALRVVMSGGTVRFPRPGSFTVSFWSSYEKYPTGGDYLGLTADDAGVFHPLWADSRNGSYDVYTSRVTVAAEPAIDINRLNMVAVSDRLTLSIDPTTFDSTKSMAAIPIRLRNMSRDTIFGPISVRIKSAKLMEGDSSNVEVLNAGNGVRRGGAVFTYAEALGDLLALPPGGVSSAMIWLIKVPPPGYVTFDFDLEFTGRLRH